MKVLTNLNLAQNELLNAVIQNLAGSPSSGKTGQIYYNTGDNQIYRYTTAGAWEAIKGSNQKIQVGTTGFDENATIVLSANAPLKTTVTGNNAVFSINDATTSQKGAVTLATDDQTIAGTDGLIAVTPKGLKAVINGLSFNNQTITANGTTFGANDAVDFVSASDYLTILGDTATKKVTLDITFPSWLLGQVLYGGNATAVGTTCTVTPSSSLKKKIGIPDDNTSPITLTENATGTGTTFGYGQLEGAYFICNDNGTFANIAFEVGDWLISTGEGWSKVDNTDTVKGAVINDAPVTLTEKGVLNFGSGWAKSTQIDTEIAALENRLTQGQIKPKYAEIADRVKNELGIQAGQYVGYTKYNGSNSAYVTTAGKTIYTLTSEATSLLNKNIQIDGTSTSYKITHKYGDAAVQVYEKIDNIWEAVIVDFTSMKKTDTYDEFELTLNFATPPATTQSFKVVIVG